MEKKINLQDILDKTLEISKTDSLTTISRDTIMDAMLEFGKQLLELAAENNHPYIGYKDNEPIVILNNRSILDTIKQVE